MKTCNEQSIGNDDHIYFANDQFEEETRRFSVFYNAVCLWRTYLQLKDKFGTKVIDYKQIGINTKSSRLDSSCTYNGDELPADDLANELQRLANTWGYDVVNIAGDSFFTAVAFQFNQFVTTTNENVPENWYFP